MQSTSPFTWEDISFYLMRIIVGVKISAPKNTTKVGQLNMGVELSCLKRLLLCPPFYPLSVNFAFEEFQLALGVGTLN